MSLPLIVLVGATATGKSRLAVDLACTIQQMGVGAEIVNADSMLVYRGMDIGTAKPTVSERRGVTHHLLDILEVTEPASVADFQVLARAAISDIRGRGAIPIVVGARRSMCVPWWTISSSPGPTPPCAHAGRPNSTVSEPSRSTLGSWKSHRNRPRRSSRPTGDAPFALSR